VATLAPAVQRYFQEGLAVSTRWSYYTATKSFLTFCSIFAIHTPFPNTEQLLCSFAAYLTDQGLASQTMKSYLAAVRNTHISLRFPDPKDKSSLPILKRVQAGIQRVRSEAALPARPRLPITAAILKKIQSRLGQMEMPHKELI